jgi:hypothetical protein
MRKAEQVESFRFPGIISKWLRVVWKWYTRDQGLYVTAVAGAISVEVGCLYWFIIALWGPVKYSTQNSNQQIIHEV